MSEFLMVSCGLSPQRAVTASKDISASTSLQQAHSVRHFFKHLCCFSDASIRKLMYTYPRILSVDVGRTLQPNLHSLRATGFTETELQLLVASHPFVLVTPLAIPRLEFWQTFLRVRDKKELVSVFLRNPSLITLDISTGIAPKIALLKKYGLSEADIIRIVKKGPNIMLRSLESVEALLNRAKDLGFVPDSPLTFFRGLSFLCQIRSGLFQEKIEFFKGFGWSEEEFLAAFKKAPYFIDLSKENIREKMEFFVGKAGCSHFYIVSNPTLLLYSLEKRLKPRHYAMEVLKSNGIVLRVGLIFIMCLAEKKFVEAYILRYKEQVPKIQEIYAAACAGQIPG